MNMDLLVSVLGMTATRLPILVALAISVVWVIDTPRSTVRDVALWSLVLLAVATVAGLVLNLVPMWMVQQGNYASIRSLSMWLGVGHFVLGLLNAFSLVLLVWAMTRALRARNAPAAG
ncbi:hypothetical protein KQ945_05680 [Bacillus subtilis subsp. subtilis]|nr:hypothetical protein [Bacillus subtilis subsp. subtilis]